MRRILKGESCYRSQVAGKQDVNMIPQRLAHFPVFEETSACDLCEPMSKFLGIFGRKPTKTLEEVFPGKQTCCLKTQLTSKFQEQQPLAASS